MIDKNFKENACLLPWVCLSVYAGNNCKVCCSSNIPICHVDENTDLQEVFYDKLDYMREAFLNGSIPLACRSCYAVESFGLKSRRIRSKEWSYDVFEYNEPKLQYLDINFSNICNLNCVMCSSKFSSKWVEFDKNTTLPFRQDVKSYAKIVKLPKSFIDQINIKDLKVVEIKGGEPTTDSGFIYFIDKYLEESGDAYLHFTTNLTNLSDSIKNRLKRLPRFAVDVSIDGLGDVYKYIRGRNLGKVGEYLYYLSTLNNISKLRINVTTSPYNLWDSYKIVEWASTIVPNIEINWCPITIGPFYLAPSLIPYKLRLEAADQLDKLYEMPENYTIDLDFTVNYLRTKNPERISDKRLKYVRKCFIEWTDEMNKMRDMDIYKIVPQLNKARKLLEA